MAYTYSTTIIERKKTKLKCLLGMGALTQKKTPLINGIQ